MLQGFAGLGSAGYREAKHAAVAPVCPTGAALLGSPAAEGLDCSRENFESTQHFLAQKQKPGL